MIKIYWDKSKIAMLTDQVEAAEHKHMAIQIFLCLEKKLDLFVSGERIPCTFAIVGQNVNHSFSTDSWLHFSVIIEPASHISGQLNKLLNGKDFYICDTLNFSKVQKLLGEMEGSGNPDAYYGLMEEIDHCLGLEEQNIIYDERITEILHLIEYCSCDIHTISSFARKVALSPSRLSHLFREQVGIPLKSYIQFHQMQKAFLALLQGKNITEAAMLADFNSPSHFAAAVKKMMGMPASFSLKDSVLLKVYEV